MVSRRSSNSTANIAADTSNLNPVNVGQVLAEMTRRDAMLTPAERRERMLCQLEADFGYRPRTSSARRSSSRSRHASSGSSSSKVVTSSA